MVKSLWIFENARFTDDSSDQALVVDIIMVLEEMGEEGHETVGVYAKERYDSDNRDHLVLDKNPYKNTRF